MRVTEASALNASPALPLKREEFFVYSTLLDQQKTTRNNAINTFNANLAATTATQNAAYQEAAQKAGFCAYRTNTISAATGLASLASNAATYTRSQLGILSILTPIVFSRCEQTVPPAKPFLTLSATNATAKSTLTLSISEKAYSGKFFVVADSDHVTAVAKTDDTKTWTITIDANAPPSTVTLSVTDENGAASIIAFNVN